MTLAQRQRDSGEEAALMRHGPERQLMSAACSCQARRQCRCAQRSPILYFPELLFQQGMS